MGNSCGRQMANGADAMVVFSGRAQQQLVRATEGALFGNGRIKRGDILSQYAFERGSIGSGGSGGTSGASAIQRAVDRSTGRRYGVKKLPKIDVTCDRLKMLRNETQLYLRVDHPNICRMIEIWEGADAVYIVLEHCAGGDLLELLCGAQVFPEDQCAKFVAQMLRAVAYLHDQRIVHRDLKLENWLLDSREPSARLKLLDFSLGRIWQNKSKKMRATCGTLLYVSPENLIGSYTEQTDVWSIGVATYLMICGYPPFFGTEEDLFSRVLAAEYSFNGSRWARVSAEAKDFVRRLLQKDVSLRPTALEALNHPWLARMANLCVNITRDVLSSLRLFGSRTKFQRFCLRAIAYRLTSEMTEDLEDVFLALDKSATGKLQLMDLLDAFQQAAAQSETEDLGDAGVGDTGAVSDREIEQLVRKLRDHGDDRVGYSGFLAAMLLTRLPPTAELLGCCFRGFDSEGTGFISFENVRSLAGKNEFSMTALSQMFAEADADGNGMIDYQEFVALVTNTAPPCSDWEGRDGSKPDLMSSNAFERGDAKRPSAMSSSSPSPLLRETPTSSVAVPAPSPHGTP